MHTTYPIGPFPSGEGRGRERRSFRYLPARDGLMWFALALALVSLAVVVRG